MHIQKVKFQKLSEIQEELRRIGVSEEGIAIMAKKFVFLVLKLKGVRNAAANILKQEMLSLGGEAAVHWETVRCTVPITDVLLGGTLKIYQHLAAKLKRQVAELEEIGTLIEGEVEELIEKNKCEIEVQIQKSKCQIPACR